jgi:3-oxoacyl-(acyl-carrier-protein) synthase
MTASIAGMGWVTPLGRDLFSVWTAISDDKRPDPVLLKSPMDGRSLPILRIPEDSIRDTASLPRLRRSSTISHLAVAAATDAVATAGMTPEALKRTALVFAASDGGVVYTRKFYAEIVERGEGAGSPLLFPETVYNAPASHIAARLGLAGEVLTLVGDAAAGLSAVQTGCELLAAGEADFCVVAAAQELDWITCEAYRRWGLIGGHENHAALFSEGAAAIVLTRASAGCRVLATHPGFSYPTEKDAQGRLETMLAQLLQGSQVDVVVSCASGTRFDFAEEDCVARHLSKARVLTPKSVLGEALACSTLQQVITGVMALGGREGGMALVIAAGYNRQLAGLVLTRTPDDS